MRHPRGGCGTTSRDVRRAIVLGVLLTLSVGCNSGERRTSPQAVTARTDAGPPDTGVRPRLPQIELRFDGPPPACIPVGFRVARVRLVRDAAELCGLTRSDAPRCFRFDPIANSIVQVEVDDAPRTVPDRPAIEEPARFTELSTRGARVSTRGGSLTFVGPNGNARTLTGQHLAVQRVADTALFPLRDGYFVGVVATHPDDLGAHAVIDPATHQVIVHSANLRCPANAP